jgi:WS/DGAT/MGAT family acyltransferase
VELPAAPSERAREEGSALDALLKPARSALGATMSVADTLWKEGAASLANPAHLADLAAGALAVAESLGGALLMPPDALTPLKGRLGVRKRVAWSRRVPLADVKRIGKATGAKVNDVLLAVVAGALRAYLTARGTNTEDLEIRAVVPVDLRPPARAHELGNEFGLTFLALPLGLADPLRRVAEIRHRMNAIKRSPEAQVFFGLLNIFGMTPAQIEEPVVELFGSKATAVMTNVAGPSVPLYMAGSRITDMMFWVPQSGRLGMGVSMLSYSGGVTLGIIADAQLVPDPDAIAASFEQEFRHMLAASRRAHAV